MKTKFKVGDRVEYDWTCLTRRGVLKRIDGVVAYVECRGKKTGKRYTESIHIGLLRSAQSK